MAISKPSKPQNPVSKPSKSQNPDSIDLLQSEIASFASSIGLSSSQNPPSTGFDDSDFKKTGPIKPPKADKPPRPKLQTQPAVDKNHHPRPKHRPPLLAQPSVHESNSQDLPKLPLMKAVRELGCWYVDEAELESKVLGNGGSGGSTKLDVEKVRRLAEEKRRVGERLLVQYANEYEKVSMKDGEMRMAKDMQKKGTAVDKVVASTTIVTANPIANLRSVDALLALVTSKVGKRHALVGIEALRDLFRSRLLPDRKLKSLLQRPLDRLPESKVGYSLLLFWYWEECLKERYERFIVALEEASKDMMARLKTDALKTIYALLDSKSEQERRLLSALVNKLGDPEGKGASNAVYHLENLLSNHPNMKAVVIDEVDRFLFRPHLGLRAKYHAVIFLNQILLSRKGDGPKVAKRLVDIYFALFKVLITESSGGQRMEKNNKKQDKKDTSTQTRKGESPLESDVEMDSRLLSALLTGVNRAYRFVSSDEADDIIEVQTPILFKLVHSKNFNVGVQALILLSRISSKNQIASDRFYRALYSKLLDPTVMNSSKLEMFVNLLSESMKNDVNIKRVSAFSKRLLQVALQQPSQYACGCLFILSEVLKAKPPLWNMMLQNESVDDDFEHFEDIIEGSQIVADSMPSGKLENSVDHVGMANGSNGVQTNSDASDSEEEEDLPVSSSEEDNSSEGEGNLLQGDDLNDVGKLETVSDHEKQQSELPNKGSSLPGGYNPRHREPLYCNADRTSWWELTVLASHVHPSVATMAQTLLSGANIVYNGNPINDLSLGAFLDKFMEKKPKANRRAEGTWHGGSQIAPAKKLEMKNHLIGAEILSLAEEDVPPEDLIFHKFYMNKTSSSKKSKKKKQTEDEAAVELLDVSGSDESDNEEIDDILGSGHLPLENEGDYDYDDLDDVVNEGDDDDLLGHDTDADMDSAVDHDIASDEDDGDEDDGVYDVDGGGDFNKSSKKNNKRKFGGRSGASPFASLEDYDHLLNDDKSEETKAKSGKKRKKLV
ncbi:protein SLOW WALKER 2 [Magnolia sinica]|uniref:protein SLOW WALKER 2 n=1 Tax=Magnolia sinica TaxID=86752 RepID=UPI00265B08E5|nr:protein SLOW WALKER 2 [Magnolia sinica]